MQNVWEESSGLFTAVYQCGIFMRKKKIVLNGEIGRKQISKSQQFSFLNEVEAHPTCPHPNRMKARFSPQPVL
jgi:hypothetical protein